MYFFSYQNDNRSTLKPKKSWHFRKRGQQNYKKKKVERRNFSDLLHKMIKGDIDNEEFEIIKQITNFTKVEKNNLRKRNGSAKTLNQRHQRRKTLENLSGNQVGPFFTDFFKNNKSNSLKLIFTLV